MTGIWRVIYPGKIAKREKLTHEVIMK